MSAAIEALLGILSEDDRNSFLRQARFLSSRRCQTLLSELLQPHRAQNPHIPPLPVHSTFAIWRKTTFTSDLNQEQVIATSEVVERWSFVDEPLAAAEMAINSTIHICNKILTRLEHDVTNTALLNAYHNYAKELRTGALALSEARSRTERRDAALETAAQFYGIARRLAEQECPDNPALLELMAIAMRGAYTQIKNQIESAT